MIMDILTSPLMAYAESIQDRRNYNRYRAAARAQGQDVPQLGLFSATPDVPMDWLQAQMVQGTPLADSRNSATGLYFGGGINGQQYQSALQGIDQDIYGQQQALARQRIASGPAYMNAQLARDRFEREGQLLEQEQADFDSTVALVMPYASADQKNILRNGSKAAKSTIVGQLLGDINAAPGAAASNLAEAQRVYVENTEPLLAYADTLSSAARYLNDVPFDADFWSTPGGRAAAGEVQRAVQVAQSRFWTDTMQRSDAPTEAEAKQLQSIFAQVNNGGFFNLDNNQRETLRLFLQREQVWNERAINRERLRFTGSATNDPTRVLDGYGPQPDGNPQINWDEGQ